MTSRSETSAKDPAPAVTRALRVLTLLEQADGQPLTLTEIARGLGAAKSSTSNICSVLEEGGMIRRTDSGYRLGLRTAELGGAFAMGFNQVREFFAVVESMPQLRREVVQVAMRAETDVLYLARHEGRVHRVGTPLGSRLPIVHAATGLAILQTMDDEEVERILEASSFTPATEHSARSPEQVRERIARARERGYVVDEGGSFAGVVGIAAPLPPWWPSDPSMAIGVAVPEAEATADTVERIGQAVVEAAARLTNPFAVAAGARQKSTG